LEGDGDTNCFDVKRLLLLIVGLAINIAACGGGPMSETEYVEALNDLVVGAGPELEASLVAFQQIDEPTLDDFVTHVEQQLAVEYQVRDKFEALDPPESIENVNQIMVDVLFRILGAAEDLIAVAITLDTLEELEQTREFAEYQTVNVDAESMCLDVQAEFDDLMSGPVIDDPWLADLQLTVRGFVDCDIAATG
jgi:hypothetical protein